MPASFEQASFLSRGRLLQIAKDKARRNSRFMQFYRQRDTPLCRGKLRFDAGKMEKVIARNRALLSQFGEWIDPEAMENSTFKFGLSAEWATAIQCPISDKMTYSDVLSYIVSEASEQTTYLEIGVSVGKNFWQVLNHVRGGYLAGMDIEDINPPLKRRMVSCSSVPMESTFASQRKAGPKLERLQFPSRGNEVSYYAGDVFDPAMWQGLMGRKFRLIFSDACHTPEAIHFEWKQLTERGLLDENGFTMIWDDLVSKEIREIFNTITSDCMRRFGLTARNSCTMHVSGWVGEYESDHPIGVISSQGFVT